MFQDEEEVSLMTSAEENPGVKIENRTYEIGLFRATLNLKFILTFLFSNPEKFDTKAIGSLLS